MILLGPLGSWPARAIDGVSEINHTCAVESGCFAGDTAGYPVTIDGSAGGSYRLTSRLVVPDENTNGIVIGTNDVAIDLNNFSIVRSGCEGATTTCKPSSGSGDGITVVTDARGLSARNGSIVGMGANGIQLGDQAEIVGLRVRWNRQMGISVGASSRVSRSSAFENGSFLAYPGISVSAGSNVLDNAASANDSDGIATSAGGAVQGNALRDNTSYGLNLAADSAYRLNVISGTGFGTVNGGLNLFSNACNGSTTCP